MGYYYTATGSFKISDAATVAMALDTQALRDALDAQRYGWGAGELFVAGRNILDDIFEFTGFEESDKTRSGDITTLDVYADSVKFNSSVDVLLNWMAGHGVGIQLSCRGEDDEAWGYSSELGIGTLDEFSMVTVPTRDVDTFKDSKAALDKIAEVLAHPGSDTEVLTAVRSIVRAVQVGTAKKKAPTSNQLNQLLSALLK
jgi:hypothetical protein